MLLLLLLYIVAAGLAFCYFCLLFLHWRPASLASLAGRQESPPLHQTMAPPCPPCSLVKVRGMDFRIERRDQGKAYWNEGVAATWTSVGERGGLEASRLYLGRLQDVWQVTVGDQQRTLLRVRWYDAAAVVEEPDYPGRLPLLRIRARAVPL